MFHFRKYAYPANINSISSIIVKKKKEKKEEKCQLVDLDVFYEDFCRVFQESKGTKHLYKI